MAGVHRVLPAAAALGVLAAGCATSGQVTSSPAPPVATRTRSASAAATSPATAPACQPALTPGLHTLTLAGRYTLVEVPPGAGRHPLVLDLHGYGEYAAQQNSYTNLSAAGAAAGVEVLTPQGLGSVPVWDFPERTAILPNDVAALSAQIRYAEQHLCAAPGHVVATGYSDGADMADTLVCAAPGLVDTVVGVAPSRVPPGCQQPVRVVEIHGTADPIVPYDGGGGDRAYPFNGLVAQPVATRMAFWTTLDHCTAAPVQVPLVAEVTETRWPGCPVDLLTETGAGHTWPGATRLRPEFGPTIEDFSATTLVLEVATGNSQALLGW